MPGTLIPPWFQRNEPNVDTLATASIIFGVSIGLAAAATIRTCRQTRKTWRRTHKVTTYVVLIWLELISSTIIAGVTWGYLRHHIEPSLWFYTGLILLWIFQTQCILQIIINRIALITVNKARIRRLKWAVFIVVLLINIAVACIWIPSRLQISTTYHDINEGWDRTEKALLAIIDVGLNLYFIYLVRSSLISLGLKRYVPLYRFNIAMIIISVAMDGLLIGMMSLPNTFLYTCFHPLAYLVKLHIELYMAELIGKIVKAAGHGPCSCSYHGDRYHANTWSVHLDPQAHDMAPTTGRFKRWSFLPRSSTLIQPTVHGHICENGGESTSASAHGTKEVNNPSSVESSQSSGGKDDLELGLMRPALLTKNTPICC